MNNINNKKFGEPNIRESREADVGFKNPMDPHISFHMPGHKGRFLFDDSPILKYDITEVPGADNLLHPEEWLLDLTNRIRDFYGVLASRILVGGSTAGCLSMIQGAVELVRKNKVKLVDKSTKKLNDSTREFGVYGNQKHHNIDRKVRAKVQRNAHISTFNALELAGVEACYFNPILENGIPSHFEINEILQGIEVCDLLILTYPFYQGGIYDLETIISLAKVKNPNLMVLVDEAHGAHLVLEEKLTGCKLSALSLGADIVVQSLHKTLPALGSTAVLHYGNTALGRTLYEERGALRSIEWYLKALQTTSPSYLLMQSIKEMMDILENEGLSHYETMEKFVQKFYLQTGESVFSYDSSSFDLKNIKISEDSQKKEIEKDIEKEVDFSSGMLDKNLTHKKEILEEARRYNTLLKPKLLKTRQDIGKILLPITNQDFFIERGIYPEMVEGNYMLFMASIANSKEDFDALTSAVLAYREEEQRNGQQNNGEFSGVEISKERISEQKIEGNSEKFSEEIVDKKIEKKPVCNFDNYEQAKKNVNILHYGTQNFSENTSIVKLSASEAVGKVSAETIVLYPPGSPIIVAGEVVTKEIAGVLGSEPIFCDGQERVSK